MKHQNHIETHRLQLWHQAAERKQRFVIAAYTVIGFTILAVTASILNTYFPNF